MEEQSRREITGPFPARYNWMTNEEYHACRGISKSGITKILQCPAKYHWEYILGNRKEQTEARLIGSALHTLVLEPSKFKNVYAISPKFDLRTKNGKECNASFERENAGKITINDEQFSFISAMASAIFGHPSAAHLLGLPGATEESFFWHEQSTGASVLCKCRPDRRIPGHKIIVDLKSCRSAAPDAFARDIFNLGYHIQAGHYLEGVSTTEGERYDEFVFIAVEKAPPHLVGVYQLDRDAIEIGRRDAEAAIRLYAQCMQNDDWPGYGYEIQPISLPRWAGNREVAIYD